MKTQLICAALLIIGMGADGLRRCSRTAPGVYRPGTPVGRPWGFSLQYCQALGMVCNEAVTLADECPAFVAELEDYIGGVLIPMMTDTLPSYIDADELFAELFAQYVGVCGEIEFLDEVGTCQPLGNEGDVCVRGRGLPWGSRVFGRTLRSRPRTT